MFCRQCGTELPDGAKFCTSCGTPQESQPQYNMQNSSYERPPNHLPLAIIVTLLCCMPLGIVSILYSGKVDSALSRGDMEEAKSMSRKAKNWAIAGLVITFAGVVLYFVMMAILVGLGTVGSIWSAQELFSI